ncbi:MAG: hypothetical protein HXY20_01160 [Acidobacteria bacterium]|nr:hypothetical protein [Acidobacteriota bacterium]
MKDANGPHEWGTSRAAGAGKGRLSDWIGLLKASGGLETVISLETWLRALKAYLSPSYLPLSGPERVEIARRDFSREAAIVRRVIQQAESDAALALTFGKPSRGHMHADSPLDVMERLAGPTESLQNLLEVLSDLRVVIESVPADQPFTYGHYLAVGRLYRHSLRNSRHVALLLHQRFKPQYDRVENATLGRILRGIENGTQQRVALVLLHLFEILKHLQVGAIGLAEDGPMRHYLAVFALVQEDSDDLRTLIRSKFAGRRALWPEPQQALEWISDRIGSAVLSMIHDELAPALRETNPAALALQMSRAQEGLRCAVQGCVVSLARAFEPSVTSDDLFGPVPETAAAMLRLHRELWDIRRMVRAFQTGVVAFQADRLIARMSSFREAHLHRFAETDWQESERLSGRLLQSRNPSDLQSLLAEFQAYLEALSRASIRRVDRPASPAGPGAN